MQQQIRVRQTGVLKGNGYLFGNIALVRGVTDGTSSSNAIARVQTTIGNLHKCTQCKGVLWHECVTISLLAKMVKDVTTWQASFGRAPLKAITISSGLSMDCTYLLSCSGLPDPTTTNPFLTLLNSLKVPIVFIDAYMLGINSDLDQPNSESSAKYYSRATTLPHFTDVFPSLLPLAVRETLMKPNMDDLA
jgi:hypothetical protein